MPTPELSQITPLPHWMPQAESRLLLVAGPCSVESHRQMVTTARAIGAAKRVQVLRAGVWKPRSKPGQFEGKGKEALPWIREVSKELGMLSAVEVAKPTHAEQCLEHRIDILWLGARTTVNPFMVQDIANSIAGTDTAIMVKNPVCPDLHLWIGAIERIARAGIKKIVAVHRGFHINTKSKYRNAPLWNIPLQLQKEIAGLPVICDPSHIAGHRDLVAQLAEQALALNMNGLMLEVHHDPGNALTDPKQQITPQMLSELLDKLLASNILQDHDRQLAAIRSLIDENDYQVLELLAERMSLASEIGKVKKKTKTDVFQADRLKDIIADRLKRGTDLGLHPSFINEIMQLLHKESVAIQSK